MKWAKYHRRVSVGPRGSGRWGIQRQGLMPSRVREYGADEKMKPTLVERIVAKGRLAVRGVMSDPWRGLGLGSRRETGSTDRTRSVGPSGG